MTDMYYCRPHCTWYWWSSVQHPRLASAIPYPHRFMINPYQRNHPHLILITWEHVQESGALIVFCSLNGSRTSTRGRTSPVVPGISTTILAGVCATSAHLNQTLLYTFSADSHNNWERVLDHQTSIRTCICVTIFANSTHGTVKTMEPKCTLCKVLQSSINWAADFAKSTHGIVKTIRPKCTFCKVLYSFDVSGMSSIRVSSLSTSCFINMDDGLSTAWNMHDLFTEIYGWDIFQDR